MQVSLGLPGASTIERANAEMSAAVLGPMTNGFHDVAGLFTPYGLATAAFVPPPLLPSFFSLIYLQGNARGLVEAPQHMLNALGLYAQAAREGVRATA